MPRVSFPESKAITTRSVRSLCDGFYKRPGVDSDDTSNRSGLPPAVFLRDKLVESD